MAPLFFEAFHLGTRIRIQFSELPEFAFLGGEPFKTCADRAFEEAFRIECAFSRFRADSQLTQLNSCLNEWSAISDEMAQLLQWGLALFNDSHGAFDLRVFKLLTDWGYGPRVAVPPSFASSDALVSSTSAPFELRQTGSLWEARTACPLDLGGLGKGYAVDRMAIVLREALGSLLASQNLTAEAPDVFGFLIDAGGDLWAENGSARDSNGNWLPWRVALEHPLDPSLALGEVALLGPRSLAGSSALRRQWTTAQGSPRHHLVDPRTQEPAQNMLGVFTESDCALWADAYATVLFVLGFESARQFAEDFSHENPLKNRTPEVPLQNAHPFDDLEVLLISPKGEFYRSPHFEGTVYGG